MYKKLILILYYWCNYIAIILGSFFLGQSILLCDDSKHGVTQSIKSVMYQKDINVITIFI